MGFKLPCCINALASTLFEEIDQYNSRSNAARQKLAANNSSSRTEVNLEEHINQSMVAIVASHVTPLREPIQKELIPFVLAIPNEQYRGMAMSRIISVLLTQNKVDDAIRYIQDIKGIGISDELIEKTINQLLEQNKLKRAIELADTMILVYGERSIRDVVLESIAYKLIKMKNYSDAEEIIAQISDIKKKVQCTLNLVKNLTGGAGSGLPSLLDIKDHYDRIPINSFSFESIQLAIKNALSLSNFIIPDLTIHENCKVFCACDHALGFCLNYLIHHKKFDLALEVIKMIPDNLLLSSDVTTQVQQMIEKLMTYNSTQTESRIDSLIASVRNNSVARYAILEWIAIDMISKGFIKDAFSLVKKVPKTHFEDFIIHAISYLNKDSFFHPRPIPLKHIFEVLDIDPQDFSNIITNINYSLIRINIDFKNFIFYGSKITLEQYTKINRPLSYFNESDTHLESSTKSFQNEISNLIRIQCTIISSMGNTQFSILSTKLKCIPTAVIKIINSYTTPNRKELYDRCIALEIQEKT